MNSDTTLGLFYTIIRPEEKWILEAAEARGLKVERLADDQVTFPMARNGAVGGLGRTVADHDHVLQSTGA